MAKASVHPPKEEYWRRRANGAGSLDRAHPDRVPAKDNTISEAWLSRTSVLISVAIIL